MIRIDRVEIFQDFMGGGAWPFLVRGLICQVDSGNERDRGEWLRLCGRFFYSPSPLRLLWFYIKEVPCQNRSVMPLDVLGRTRVTLEGTTSR